jgi:hypothetical protein
VTEAISQMTYASSLIPVQRHIMNSFAEVAELVGKVLIHVKVVERVVAKRQSLGARLTKFAAKTLPGGIHFFPSQRNIIILRQAVEYSYSGSVHHHCSITLQGVKRLKDSFFGLLC